MEEAQANDLLTKGEAAVILRVSKVTISRLITARKLAAYKIGRRVFLTRRHINEFLLRSEKKGEE